MFRTTLPLWLVVTRELIFSLVRSLSIHQLVQPTEGQYLLSTPFKLSAATNTTQEIQLQDPQFNFYPDFILSQPSDRNRKEPSPAELDPLKQVRHKC